MSPNQKRERRREIEQVAVNKIIDRERIRFFSDEGRRATTVPELVAALRALKARLRLQLKGANQSEWVESTEALIDMEIEKVIAFGESKTNPKPAKKPKASFWLPKLFKKRDVKPDQN